MDRKEIVAKKKQFIYPAVANYYNDPLPLERGEMHHMWDVEGKRYLDFFGGIVTVGVGHCNPRITSVQKAQIDKLGHTSTLFPHQTMMELAEKIARITPGQLQKSFFTSSGPKPMRPPSNRRGCTRATWIFLRCAMDIRAECCDALTDRNSGVAKSFVPAGHHSCDEPILLPLSAG